MFYFNSNIYVLQTMAIIGLAYKQLLRENLAAYDFHVNSCVK